MSNQDNAERMARHGFKLEATGGGCTAYVRTDTSGECEELVTMRLVPQAPCKLTDLVSVCDGPAGAPEWHNEPYTLADVLAALDNPSEEYYLLALRLYNGLHKAAR